HALQRGAPMRKLSPRLLERLPGGVAARPSLPRAGVALDSLQRVLGVAATLALDERVEVELAQPRQERAALARERLPEVSAPAMMVRGEIPDGRRQEKRGRRPEDSLDVPGLAPHQRAVREKRVEENPVAAQPVHRDYHPEPTATAPLPEQNHATGLDV